MVVGSGGGRAHMVEERRRNLSEIRGSKGYASIISLERVLEFAPTDVGAISNLSM